MEVLKVKLGPLIYKMFTICKRTSKKSLPQHLSFLFADPTLHHLDLFHWLCHLYLCFYCLKLTEYNTSYGTALPNLLWPVTFTTIWIVVRMINYNHSLVYYCSKNLSTCLSPLRLRLPCTAMACLNTLLLCQAICPQIIKHSSLTAFASLQPECPESIFPLRWAPSMSFRHSPLPHAHNTIKISVRLWWFPFGKVSTSNNRLLSLYRFFVVSIGKSRHNFNHYSCLLTTVELVFNEFCDHRCFWRMYKWIEVSKSFRIRICRIPFYQFFFFFCDLRNTRENQIRNSFSQLAIFTWLIKWLNVFLCNSDNWGKADNQETLRIHFFSFRHLIFIYEEVLKNPQL